MEKKFGCELLAKKSMFKDLLDSFMTERIELVMNADAAQGVGSSDSGDDCGDDSDDDDTRNDMDGLKTGKKGGGD
jgi:hypothetical protein